MMILTSKPFTRPVNVIFSQVFCALYYFLLEDIFPDRNTTSSEYLFLTNTSPAPVKTLVSFPLL